MTNTDDLLLDDRVTAARTPTESLLIETDRGRYALRAPRGGVVLREALRAGISLPYACASGTCGSCAATVVDGSLVDLWPSAPGLNARMRKLGRVLLCQSAVNGPVCVKVTEDADDRRKALTPADSRVGRLVERTFRAPGVSELLVEVDEPLAFAPGQFVLVSFPGVRGMRALSIANCERSPISRIRLLVRPRQGSDLEAALWSEAATLEPLELVGPLGVACLHDGEVPDEILCVAGSTGIAPMLPILDEWLRRGAQGRARLLYGVRARKDMIVLDDVLALAKRGLAITIALSEPADGDLDMLSRELSGMANVIGGFAHEGVCDLVAGEPGRRLAFVAGPRVMVQASVKALMLHGKLPPAAIRCDDF